MNNLQKDDLLFNLLNVDISIISSQILRFNISINDKAILEVDIKLLYQKGKYLKLIFSDIDKYAFYNCSCKDPYYIVNYKFFKKEHWYYMSFDPEESELTTISEDDNDFVICKHIDGYIYEI